MRKKSTKKKFFKIVGRWILTIILVSAVGFLLWENFKSFQKYMESKRAKNDLKQQVIELQKKKQNLQQKLQEVETEENLEEVAREELSLKKEGEEVYAVLSSEEEKQEIAKEIKKKSLWEQVKNFIGNSLALINPF